MGDPYSQLSPEETKQLVVSPCVAALPYTVRHPLSHRVTHIQSERRNIPHSNGWAPEGGSLRESIKNSKHEKLQFVHVRIQRVQVVGVSRDVSHKFNIYFIHATCRASFLCVPSSGVAVQCKHNTLHTVNLPNHSRGNLLTIRSF